MLAVLLAELFLSNVLVSHILCPGSWQWEEGSLPVLPSVEELSGGACSGFCVCTCELGRSVLADRPIFLLDSLIQPAQIESF